MSARPALTSTEQGVEKFCAAASGLLAVGGLLELYLRENDVIIPSAVCKTLWKTHARKRVDHTIPKHIVKNAVLGTCGIILVYANLDHEKKRSIGFGGVGFGVLAWSFWRTDLWDRGHLYRLWESLAEWVDRACSVTFETGSFVVGGGDRPGSAEELREQRLKKYGGTGRPVPPPVGGG